VGSTSAIRQVWASTSAAVELARPWQPVRYRVAYMHANVFDAAYRADWPYNPLRRAGRDADQA